MEDIWKKEWPKKDGSLSKISFDVNAFMRIWWFYDVDLKQHEDDEMISLVKYSGIVIPKPEVRVSGPIDVDSAHVVMDEYPIEKENPTAVYFSLSKLLDQEGLVKLLNYEMVAEINPNI